MLQKERRDLVEQVKDISFNLLVVDKFAFIFTTETGKPDDAIVIIEEVFLS